MPKIDRATLTKIAPDPQSVKALEDLFKESSDSTGAIAKVTKIANDAQLTANSANLAAKNAQSTADSAFSAANAAQSDADEAQSTADMAKASADNAAAQVAIIESPEGAHVVGIVPLKNVSGTNVRDAIYELDSNDGSGFRNVILNGAFTINQRSYPSNTATGVANQYTLDMWRVVVAGQSLSYTPTSNGNLATAPTGGLEQVVEGALITQQNYVMSWLGNATCTVNGSAVLNGGQLSLTPGANCTVRFSAGSVNSVQLEPGKTARPVEPRPYSVELRLCQRYAFVWNSLGTMGVCASGGGRYAFTFPNVMRAVPTYTELSNSTVADGATTITITGTTVDNVTPSAAAISFTATGTVTGRAAVLNTGGTALFSANL